MRDRGEAGGVDFGRAGVAFWRSSPRLPQASDVAQSDVPGHDANGLRRVGEDQPDPLPSVG